MKLLLLMAALAADPVLPADAPVVVMESGDPAPSRGLFMTEAHAIAHAKHEVEVAAKLKVYEDADKAKLSPAVIIVIAVGAAVAGGFVGYGISKAVK